MQSQLTHGAKQLVTRPLRYYLDDTASHTLITYAGIKAIVALGALLVFSLRYGSARLFAGKFPFSGWDVYYYRGIAREGYSFDFPYSAPFAPLYPLLIKLFSLNNPAVMTLVAWLLANAFSFIGLYFLYKLVPLVVDERYRLRVCFAYMVFPILAVVSLVPYTEALFLALTIGAYYYWKRSKFGFAALLAAGSIFTRQVGAFIVIIFVVDMLYEYWTHHDKPKALKQLAVVGTTCLSVGGLYLFYYLTFGDPFIVSKVDAVWETKHSATPVPKTAFALTHLPTNLLNDLASGWIAKSLHPYGNLTPYVAILAVFVLAAAAFFLVKKQAALSLYSVSLLVLFLSVRTPMSFIRFIAALFPLYLLFGALLSEDWRKNILIGTIALVIAIQNMVLWIRGLWLF